MAAKKTEPEVVNSAYEAAYTIDDLVNAAASEFNTTRVVVRAALTGGGKDTYTLKAAKKLVDVLKTKEVRA